MGFVGEQKDFVGDAGFDRQPVQTGEDGGDGLPRLGAGENPGSRVVDVLEHVQVLFG